MSIAALDPSYMKADDTPTYTKPKDTLGRDQFLTLLVAQLQHQDPLNPLEGTEFTAQLCQFSSLEQLFGINEGLEDIQGSLSTGQQGDILDYIGKSVKATSNTIYVNEGKMNSGSYDLEQGADVTIFIYDSSGNVVRTLHPGQCDAGIHEVSWDGRDSLGNMVVDGVYTFGVEARDEAGFLVPYNPYLTGEVTGVTYESSVPLLIIGDQLVTPEKIVEVTKTVPAE